MFNLLKRAPARFMKSFGYCWDGIKATFTKEESFRLETIAFVLLAAVGLDLVVAALQPGIAHQGVFVGGALAHRVDREQLRAQVDQLQTLQEVARAVVLDLADRRQRHVTAHADHIPHGARAKQRQLDIARVLPTPDAQGLAEVLAALGHLFGAGRIEQAADTDGGVDQETSQGIPGVITAALLARGVIIKPWREPGFETFIRVSIGSPADNSRLLATLREILAGA